MNLPHLFAFALFLLFTVALPAATPPGKTQQLTSADQVPDGLAKSDWQSIRTAYEAGRQEEPGTRYPLAADSIAQQAYLKPAAVGTTQEGDWFGWSVAVSGDTVVVGAPHEGSSTTGVNSTPDESAVAAGAAYVFVRNTGVWTQQAYLKPAAVGTTQAGDWFGWSVAVSGDTVVVGAPFEGSSTTGVNSMPDEGAAAAGAAYVFVRNAGVWTQQAYLKPTAVGTTQAGDFFGHSVAVSGDTVVVGAPYEDSSTTGVNGTPDESAPAAGAACVFVRSGTTWTQQACLKPAAVGTTQADDRFGCSVAVSGDTMVVGAFKEDSSTTGVDSTPDEGARDAGAAYVFTRNAGVWMQQAYLKPAAVGTTQVRDQFGYSVAVSGDTVVVGAPYEGSSTTGVNSTPDEGTRDAGAAYVFTRSAGVWTQQAYLKSAAVGTTQAPPDQLGYSVAVSGDTVVVGANAEDSSTTDVNSTPDEGAIDAGAAYVFVRSGTTWTQQAYLKPAAVGITQEGDSFGWSVAVSGYTVLVGAWKEDSSTTGVNGTPDESSLQSGAACIFTGLGPSLTALQAWRLQYFGTASNSGNAADNFDFDGDGLVNILEWDCHLNPTLPSTLPVALVRNGAHLEFTSTRSVSAVNAGAIFAVEWGDTLAPPSWSTSGVSETILSDDGTVQQVKALVPAGSSGQRFVHLKVTGPP